MTLQSSGAISLANVQTEFGGSNPIGIDEYYAISSQVKTRYAYLIQNSANTTFLNEFGNAGANPHPPSGFTSIQNSSVDDAFVTIPLNFTYKFLGISYTEIYVGSNTYITFGSGSTAFGGLSASNPALPKIFLGAADNSYQRVSYIYGSANTYLRVRYEGTAGTGGTVGSPNIVYEIIFFDPRSTGFNNVFQLYVGVHGRINEGLFRICSSSADILNLDTGPVADPLFVNTGYLFQSNSSGNNFTVTRSSHFTISPSNNPISLADFYGLSATVAVVPLFVATAGRVLPFNGDAGSSSGWPPTGYTSIQNSSTDDAFLQINLPFAYRKDGVNYTSIFVGSNSYITFGTGSTQYSGLSASNPNVPTLHIGSADNSWQRVAYKSSTNYLIVRFEGTAATSGSVGSPNIVWEATFFRYGAVNLDSTVFSDDHWGHIIMLNVGNHNRTNGVFGISNGSVFDTSGTIAAGQSYLIMGRDANGSNQRIETNARMVNVSEGFN